MRRIVERVFALGILLFATGVFAQTYSSKLIRIITTQPGGGSDVLARVIAPPLSASLGQPVVVDNRTALVAVETAAKAPPDGYTLLVNGSALWLQPLLRDNVPWDPVRDFAPITLAISAPTLLVVHPSVPVKSVRDLIALAKAQPGQLNYAAGTLGATPHIAGELFKSMAGVNIVRVPYKGTGPALIGLLTGEAHLMFPNAASALGHIKQGKLRALAVGTAEPSPLVPGVPTIAASGLPGYVSESPQGVFAPAGIPAPIVTRLNQEIARILSSPDVKPRLVNSGTSVVASSPDAFAAAIKADIARISKLSKQASIREE
jgi:tripartite-type tricarboxylate transporter receptor subunit TctC